MREDQALAAAFHAAAVWLDPQAAAISAPEVAETGLLRAERMVRELARLYGVRVRRVRLRHDGWWRHAVLPAIAFVAEGRRPVALAPSWGRYAVCDGGAQSAEVDARFAATLETDAFLLYRRLPAAVTLPRLVRIGLSDSKLTLLAFAAWSVLAALAGAAVPWVVLRYGFRMVPLGLAVAGLALFEFWRSLAVLRMEGRARIALVSAVWDRLLRTALPYFSRNDPEEVAAGAHEASALAAAVTTFAGSAAGALSAAAASAVVMVLAAPAAGILAPAAVVAIAMVELAVRWHETHLEDRLERAGRRQAAFLSYMVRHFLSIRQYGAAERMCTDYGRRAEHELELTGHVRHCERWRSAVAAATPAAALAVAAPHLLHLAPAACAAFLIALAQFIAAVRLAARHSGALLRLSQIRGRLEPITTAPTDREAPGGRRLRLNGSISLAHVSFTYPDAARPALDDVSLEVAPGEFIGLAGPSGSGKSTLIRLLLGLEAPDSGLIAYDGAPLGSLDAETTRSQIEAVFQDEYLSEGTIRSNISGASPHGLEEAWQAAAVASVDEEIDALPMGMLTFVHDGVLSSGQQQRILLAGALVRRPAILLLDEALSGLEEELQRRILTNLRRIPEMTCIVASHRDSALSLLDRTYRFERGRVIAVEAGHPEPPVAGDPVSRGRRGPGYRIYREEALARFHSAEPLDRMVRLTGLFGRG